MRGGEIRAAAEDDRQLEATPGLLQGYWDSYHIRHPLPTNASYSPQTAPLHDCSLHHQPPQPHQLDSLVPQSQHPLCGISLLPAQRWLPPAYKSGGNATCRIESGGERMVTGEEWQKERSSGGGRQVGDREEFGGREAAEGEEWWREKSRGSRQVVAGNK